MVVMKGVRDESEEGDLVVFLQGGEWKKGTKKQKSLADRGTIKTVLDSCKVIEKKEERGSG